VTNIDSGMYFNAEGVREFQPWGTVMKEKIEL